MRRFIRTAFASLTILTSLAGARVDASEPLIVFAAASLKDTMEDVGKAYTAAGGAEIKFSFAASSVLAKQIEAGHSADLFASADLAWMEYLDGKALVQHETRVNLLGNSLVVIAPAKSAITTLDLTPEAFLKAIGDGRLVTCDVNAVPAGIYAKSALQSVGLWNALESKLAQAENVRTALAFVARGEAPLGIVYATDAMAEKNVRLVATFPATSHAAITYPFAITSLSTHPDGPKFLGFLKGPVAKSIFEKAGFPVLVP